MGKHCLLVRGAIPGVTYYASGSNHPGEILGFAESGVDVGVSAREVREAAENAMVEAAAMGARVFIDSGAFAELGRDGSEGEPPDWPAVLDLYQRMARRIGPALTVVAPDKVGDQAATLARMRDHAVAVRALIAAGVEVLAPLQYAEAPAPGLFDVQANA